MHTSCTRRSQGWNLHWPRLTSYWGTRRKRVIIGEISQSKVEPCTWQFDFSGSHAIGGLNLTTLDIPQCLHVCHSSYCWCVLVFITSFADNSNIGIAVQKHTLLMGNLRYASKDKSLNVHIQGLSIICSNSWNILGFLVESRNMLWIPWIYRKYPGSFWKSLE
jgi:hypothetical protein